MALTKEECVIAWNCIKGLDSYPIECSTNETQDKFKIIPFAELFGKQIALIDNLIKEHFDIPPLKFEEIHDGMWVWDTKFCNENNVCEPTMVYITKVKMEHWGGSIVKYPTVYYKTVINPLFGTFDAIKFEDNRYYAREVKCN